MGFEGDNLGMLVQRAVGVELLILLVPPYVYVDAVSESQTRPWVLRLVALRMEPEPDLEVSACVYAIRVQVNLGRMGVMSRVKVTSS